MKAPYRQRPSPFRLFGRWPFVLVLAAGPVYAEVKYDGSMGTSGRPGTILSGGRTTFQIRDAEGQRRDTNLFHSFEKFDLTSAEGATFLGPAAIKNILARVTNGASSSIDGKISSQISGANLFLMNPKGIVFGPNASVDVSGSFFATTADYIKLGADGRFAASADAADSVLTVSDPAAFGFLTPNPAAIRVNGSKLNSANVKTLGFVGGDVSITGDADLQAEDVQLISVRSVGEAGLQLPSAANTLRWAEINVDGFSRRGTVTMERNPANAAPAPAGPAITSQRVVIRGGTFVMKQANITTINSVPGDGVKVDATESLQMSQSSIDTFNFGDMMQAYAGEITAGEASLDRSSIGTSTAKEGAGGHLRMEIGGALRLTGQSSIFTDSYSSIAGGDLSIKAASIALESDSAILSQSDFGLRSAGGSITIATSGELRLTRSRISMGLYKNVGQTLSVEAGSLTVEGRNAGFLFSDYDIAENTTGARGSIRIVSHGDFSIQDATGIQASSFAPTGVLIDISAASLRIDSANTASIIPVGIVSTSGAGEGGQGGDIRLKIAGSLQVLNGAVISAEAYNAGAGGNIDITAASITVTGRGGAALIENENARGITARNRSDSPLVKSGPSGNITLTVSGLLDVRDGGAIVVDTNGFGRGGNIHTNAGAISVTKNGAIAARTFGAVNAGAGGNVQLNAAGEIFVGTGGFISTSTAGSGDAGNISLRSSSLRVSGSGALISAISGAPNEVLAAGGLVGTGAGGNIMVSTRDLLVSDDGLISASTYGPGAGGSVRIDADRLRIQDSGGEQFAGISAQTLSLGAGGAGGAISINADTFELRGAGAQITTESLGAGNAGQIQINSGIISLRDGGGVQSSSTGSGRSGSLDLRARQTISLRDGGYVSVASTQADAGNINLRAGVSIRLDNASITAEAARNGGNIDLRAPDRITLLNSEITAAAGLNGGNIFIDPVYVFLNGSVISANAIAGRGGNIRIISDFYFASPDSLVTATSLLGVDGTVRIDALNNDLRDNLVDLPSELIDADSLLRELCTMKMDDFSSLVSEGRGGLPPLPSEPLPSLMILP